MIKVSHCISVAAMFVVALLVPRGFAEQPAPADLILTGDVTGTQNHSYIEVPFQVPSGTHRISVDFEYSGREERATLDLGIADPERFRGASGGNKSHFTISETDATPSYLPGAIPAGRWKLLLAVPNIRPQTVAHYKAEIRFNSSDEDSGFAAEPLGRGKRWYRGDLHMHTAHSDGSCASQSGTKVPCPLFLTAQTAAARGLDFIAITDHNTTSQYNEMRELQPYFDRLLLIPGREMTTFWGHFNIFGVTQFIDYRVTQGSLDLNTVLRDVKSKGGIASVNHAEAPGGEKCMGCRWEPSTGVDMDLFASVEVVNGGATMFSSSKYWDSQLAAGHRLTAIGGSDSHNATSPPKPPDSIGWPTTVVEAENLSVSAILNGIRSGRAFVDLTASHDKAVDFEADAGSSHAHMGETLDDKNGENIHMQVHAIACAGSNVHVLLDGTELKTVSPIAITGDVANVATDLAPGTGRHWLRIELRDSKRGLQLITSPIYINFPPENR